MIPRPRRRYETLQATAEEAFEPQLCLACQVLQGQPPYQRTGDFK